jgi:hypothetical protein
MTTWTKTNSGRYEATINGRAFILRCNRKTRTHTVSNPRFICIGRKPRYSTSTTWYNVYERSADGTPVERTDLCNLPGSLAEAKALAARIAGQ